VIYLHGFASSPRSSKAEAFRRRAAELGVSLEVPDLNPPDFRDLSLTAMAARVEELIAAGDDPVGLVGSSLGGYLAALVGGRSPRVRALVLLAPGVDIHRRWLERLPAERLREWRERGSIPVFHYGLGEERELGYGFFEELAGCPAHPDTGALPVLLYHGRADDVIPLALIEDYARGRARFDLRVVPDGHDLRESTPEIVESALAFLKRHLGE
jgi:pimeloyl-ACP methyl ester carboxylesterase